MNGEQTFSRRDRPGWPGYYWPIVAGVLALSLLWRLNNLDSFAQGYDEGAYLTWGALVSVGYRLYSQVRVTTPPLFIVSIAAVLKVLGLYVVAARAMILGLAVLLLLVVSLLARRAWGDLAGLVGTCVLSFAPLFFQYSRTCTGDVPSLALAALAVLLALRYRDSGRLVWLVLAGLITAASFLMKMLSPFVALLTVWFVIRARLDLDRWRRVAIALILLGLCLVLPVLLCLFFYDTGAMYEQVVLIRQNARLAYPLDLAQNWQRVAEFAARNAGLIVLAAYGGLVTALKRRERWVLAWLALALATAMIHTPLWYHHLVALLPPLAILAGVAVAHLLGVSRDAWFLGFIAGPKEMAFLAVGLGACLVYLAQVPGHVAENNALLAASPGGRELAAVEFIQQTTEAGDFVASDDLMLLFRAGRLVPPPFGDVSVMAIRSGFQTDERLIELTAAYDCPLVVAWRERFAWLPDYVAWVEENYLGRQFYDDQHRIYYARKAAAEEIEHRREANLGNLVRLRGYKLEDKHRLTLYWQAQTEMQEDYTVFVHLLDESGNLREQADSQPWQGFLPTSAWPAGEIVPDPHLLPELPPGRYRLAVGLYSLSTMERLPVLDGAEGDSISLCEIALGEGY